jgi:hypothetical protein
MDQDLMKHAREFKGRIENNQYEVTDTGILFPAAHAVIFGEYVHDVNGQDERVDHNLLPTEAVTYILDVALRNQAQLPSWFLALFGTAYTPTAGITAATFPATAGEITSVTEGYSETTRQVWTPAPANGGVIDNTASKATFNIVTSTQLMIRGAALVSSSVKGGTTGVLASISRFNVDRVQYNGDVFNLGYRVRLQAA